MTDLQILVVDDSLTMRKIIINILGKLGYTNIIGANNGIDAIGKMYINQIGLILTDWEMPEMDGLSFIKAVREEVSFKEIPILVITKKREKKDIVKALKAGADNYLGKPFTEKDLEEKIHAILKKKS